MRKAARQPTSPRCLTCGEQPKFITSMLNPSSRRTFRMFECQCGNKTWSSDGLSRHDAAWDEATVVCSDMIRDIITRLGDSPEWRLEVADKSDRPPSFSTDRRELRSVGPPQLAASFIIKPSLRCRPLAPNGHAAAVSVCVAHTRPEAESAPTRTFRGKPNPPFPAYGLTAALSAPRPVLPADARRFWQ